MRRRSVEFNMSQFSIEQPVVIEPTPVRPQTPPPVITDSLTHCTSLPVQIRPLVLFISEIEYIASIHKLYIEHKNLSTAQHTEDKLDLINDANNSHVQTIDYQKVGEYLMSSVQVVSCDNRHTEVEITQEISRIRTARHLSSDALNSGLRFSLPLIDDRRRTKNEGKQVDYSTRILQKAYRGFCGRKRFKRVLVMTEYFQRHVANTTRLQNRIAHVRLVRGNIARIVQCNFRGYRWRKELRRLNLMALIIQCAFRVFRAVNRANAERIRRDGHPQVFEMIKGERVGVF
jgi:hypothetical protein